MPDSVLKATRDALQGAFDARKAGSMDSARAYLETRPDIVEVGGDETALRFRLEGGSPAWFIDRSAITPAAATTASFSITDRAPGDLHALTPQAVVGEDRNQDGKVNNRDPKKALVLAPYLWQFAPYDESPLLAERMNLMPDYEGNVTYKANPTEADQNLTIEDYWSWDEYDTIFVATHGNRACWSTNCGVIISSGVRWNTFDRPPVTTGALLIGAYDEEAKRSNVISELGLAVDFFRGAYAEGLDDALLSFSACETGAWGASDLAAAIGGSNFVMMGWTEDVPTGGAFNALGLFQEKLEQGLPAKEALRLVREAGLSPIPNGNGVMTDFTRFAPSGGDQRIREVITVLGPAGDPLEDGTDVTGIVDGTPGDGDHDRFDLSVQIDGVLPDERAEFEVSFELDGEPLEKTSNLIDAEAVGEFSYRLAVEDVPTGIDLQSGKAYELEAIVSLPEGGESRYAAIVDVNACFFDATVGNPFPGAFSGPARFRYTDSGKLGVSFTRDAITGAEGSEQFFAGFETAPGVPLAPGTHELVTGSAVQHSVYLAVSYPGNLTDCVGCGGTMTIVNATPDVVSGRVAATVPVVPFDGEDETVLVQVQAEFVAVPGSQYDPDSPYVQCKISYVED